MLEDASDCWFPSSNGCKLCEFLRSWFIGCSWLPVVCLHFKVLFCVSIYFLVAACLKIPASSITTFHEIVVSNLSSLGGSKEKYFVTSTFTCSKLMRDLCYVQFWWLVEVLSFSTMMVRLKNYEGYIDLHPSNCCSGCLFIFIWCLTGNKLLRILFNW